MTYIIGQDGPSNGEGPIRKAIRQRAEAKKVKEELEGKQMTVAKDDQPSSPARDKELSFTHKDWVRLYEGMLTHTLAKVSERVTKISSGGQFPASYELKHRIFVDRLTNHPSNAAAVVGVEIHIRENGVSRMLARQTRFFRTVLEYNEGKDQGIMECLQNVFEDFTTLAVTTDIAIRYEQQQNKDNQGSV